MKYVIGLKNKQVFLFCICNTLSSYCQLTKSRDTQFNVEHFSFCCFITNSSMSTRLPLFSVSRYKLPSSVKTLAFSCLCQIPNFKSPWTFILSLTHLFFPDKILQNIQAPVITEILLVLRVMQLTKLNRSQCL